MCDNHNKNYTRRDFLTKTTLGMGALSLGAMIDPTSIFGNAPKGIPTDFGTGGVLGQPHFAPKAKRIIYLFQSGAPSQLDLFDYKPLLNKMQGQDLPESVHGGQRLTGMTSGQASLPLAGTLSKFNQYGDSGAWMTNLMPYTSKIVDELCFIKSMYTEAINHDPAITFIQTGSQLPGRPSMGSWLSYGLGTDNKNLPEFVVLVTKGKTGGQPLYSRLWGNGFLPSQHQGVQFRAGKDPVLYLTNPPGVDAKGRREQLDYLQKLEQLNHNDIGDPEILARMAQYEMAFRMQTSVPEIMDTADEPDYIYDMYGEDSKIPGTFAANALLARRLAERDVKFIQLYHQGWDQHGNLPNALNRQCKDTDQATAALIKDLKQRGMLEDTLVIWGGEFGRTNYSQGQLTATNFGRDHHGKCFTIFMAGAGIKGGVTLGATDDFGFNITQRPVHVHDFQATVMHLLGIDHERLTFKFQGRRYRLTDVHGEVVKEILA
ncbi:DUF1501 domain-containing protein [Maribacter aestuarii]|uniref:DUF1501 domain-containing protein n=1 Tax=Maribacter aestuarii TaxID=1130723 RepID=UPI00248AC270|nr:DUF1501 domain-containing protein [Maribacter aestuarii]